MSDIIVYTAGRYLIGFYSSCFDRPFTDEDTI